MKKNLWKYGCTLLAGSILILNITGCGRVTAESLMNSMSENMSKVNDYKIDMSADLNASGSMSGVTLDVQAGLDIALQLNVEPQILYADGNIWFKTLGMEQKIDVASYSMKEDPDIINYFQIGKSEWKRNTITNPENDPDVNIYNELTDLSVNLELEDHTSQLEDIECYKLKGLLDTNALRKMADSLYDQFDEAANIYKDVNWAEIEIPIEFYVSKKEKMPVKISVELKPLLMGLMKSIDDQKDLSINCDHLTLNFIYSSFGEIGTISLPQEIKDIQTEKTSEAMNSETENITTKTI